MSTTKPTDRAEPTSRAEPTAAPAASAAAPAASARGADAAGRPLPTVPCAQRVLAGIAIAATLPYAALKILWLTGSRVGLNDPDFGTSRTMDVLNGLTGALDVVALALAITFLTRRGYRAPAAIVVPPMWVGAGLLGTILATLPVQVVAGLLVAPSATGPELPPIAGWVFTMVYGGFSLLGIGLLGAFGLYAMRRWGSTPPPEVTRGARRALLAAAGAVVVQGIAQGAVHAARADASAAQIAADSLVSLAAAGSLALLARPAPGRRIRDRAAVVGAFVATGSLAAWGVYTAVLTGLPNDLTPGGPSEPAVVWSAALRAAVGIAGAGALALRLRRRGPRRRPPTT